MSISASGTINRLASAQVPAYGSPNPEGVAVCNIAVTGDASGGTISGGIVSSGQFLYRLELFHITQNVAGADTADVFTLHDWATQAFGFGANSFDILWPLLNTALETGQAYSFLQADMDQIKRIVLGSVRNVGVLNILFFDGISNVDTTVYKIVAMFTYWRKEALALPGFLQAFYEAPFVPGGVAL